MRDWKKETDDRIEWIRTVLADAGAKGVVFANSGGMDSTLVGALCRSATEKVLGLIMPCGSNSGENRELARLASSTFGISSKEIDLTPIRDNMVRQIQEAKKIKLSETASDNLAPRLRMSTLHAISQSGGFLIAGAGNISEGLMGYLTKWGEGAYDFNPIADLTAAEVLEFGSYLGVPEPILKNYSPDQATPASLLEIQSDESEIGLACVGKTSAEDRFKIEPATDKTGHKREMPRMYGINTVRNTGGIQ